MVSLLLSFMSTLFVSWTGGVLFRSSKFFDPQVPSISNEVLVLPHHACYVLSRLCCNKHNLLLSSYRSRICRIENPSCSACGHLSQDTSPLILHCPATDSLATFCLSMAVVPNLFGSITQMNVVSMLYYPQFTQSC